jgi:hypothetical protein
VQNKEGNSKAAQALLAQGKAEFPGNARFQKALDTCEKNAGKCKYEMQLNFNWDFKELEGTRQTE